jgi:predicted outer membrane repeat protein
MCKPFTFLLVALLMSAYARAAVVYVDDTAPPPPVGANDGSSWENAFLDLQDALAAARSGDEIRVGQGVYKPAPPGGSREATFNLFSGIVIQGGYAGFGASDPDANDPEKFQTVLSGDLDGDDGPPGGFANYGENSYHVVTIDAGGTGIEVRGVIIKAGYANGGNPGDIHHMAGGLVCLGEADLTLHQCIFIHNQAQIESGAMRSVGGSLNLRSCTFETNRVVHPTGGPGALSMHDAMLDNCVFHGNQAGVGVVAGIGGAIDCSGNLTINGGIFENNAGEWGAAIRFDGTAAVNGAVFLDNGGLDGAIHVRNGSHLTATGCEFTSNGGDTGGAISIASGGIASLYNCFLHENSATRGGAIDNRGTLLAMNCTFRENHLIGPSGGGGGIYNNDDCTLVTCTFAANRSNNNGGGIYNNTGATLSAVNCAFTGNETWLTGNGSYYGGGLYNGGSATVINSSMSGNKAKTFGGAIASTAVLNLSNSILWENISVDGIGTLQDAQLAHAGATNINHACIQGWDGLLKGDGNHGYDPNFVDADGADEIYGTEDDNPRLLANSPCIEGGDNDALPPDTFDMDDDGDTSEPLPVDLDFLPRVVGANVDMGAFEFQGTPCRADIDGDGAVEVDDLVTVILDWGACTSGSSCPADVDLNMQVDVDDLVAVILGWGACP